MNSDNQKEWEYIDKSAQEEQQLKAEHTENPDVELHFDEAEAQPYLALDKASLIKELLKLKQESQQRWEQFVRAKAETNNILHSAEKEKQNIRNYTLKSFVQALANVLDNFDRSLALLTDNLDTVEAVRAGIELTHKDLLSTLEKFGVEVLNPVNETFNPEFHEAISMQPTPGVAVNIVVQVLQKGCLLNGRLVRPAMVVVASA